jgi:hypothetical protein
MSSSSTVTLAKLTSADQLPAAARSSFAISSPHSPADMRRATLAQVDSVDRLRAVTRADLEMAEEECPDLLLDRLLRLFLPHLEAEVDKQRREKAKQREKTNMTERVRSAKRHHHHGHGHGHGHLKSRKSMAGLLSQPAHPALLQSASYGLHFGMLSTSFSSTSPASSAAAAAANDKATAKMKRIESFTPSRLNEGTGGDADEGEEEEEDLLSQQAGGEAEPKRGGGGGGRGGGGKAKAWRQRQRASVLLRPVSPPLRSASLPLHPLPPAALRLSLYHVIIIVLFILILFIIVVFIVVVVVVAGLSAASVQRAPARSRITTTPPTPSSSSSPDRRRRRRTIRARRGTCSRDNWRRRCGSCAESAKRPTVTTRLLNLLVKY